MSISQIEWLFEVSLKVLCQNLVGGSASPILINILEQVMIDEVELVSLLCSTQGHNSRVACVVDLPTLYMYVGMVSWLGNRIHVC